MIVAGIPAYNEEETIARIIIESFHHVDKVLVCNDGSEDLTGDIAKKLGAEVITHDRNRGYGEALRSLFNRAREAEADSFVILDADGQHDPKDIPKLLQPILNGEADFVIGSRFLMGVKSDIPRVRKWGIESISRVSRVGKIDVSDAQSGFRAFSRKAVKMLAPVEMGMGASTELLLKGREVGLKIIEVPIQIKYFNGEGSKHHFIFQGFDVIGSTLKFISLRHPLIFYGIPGILAFLIGIGFGIWAINIYSSEGRLVTNLALISLFGFIAGLILITTSIIIFSIISAIRER